ncbi:MAG: hypothetical protein N2644_00935 [Candidatus Sumerlaea chitinivorans]|nr:hypothetical protein [Candidatus Sumerlaea chitinivorans]
MQRQNVLTEFQTKASHLVKLASASEGLYADCDGDFRLKWTEDIAHATRRTGGLAET